MTNDDLRVVSEGATRSRYGCPKCDYVTPRLPHIAALAQALAHTAKCVDGKPMTEAESYALIDALILEGSK